MVRQEIDRGTIPRSLPGGRNETPERNSRRSRTPNVSRNRQDGCSKEGFSTEIRRHGQQTLFNLLQGRWIDIEDVSPFADRFRFHALGQIIVARGETGPAIEFPFRPQAQPAHIDQRLQQ